jgi:hypothetical protein
MSVSVWTLFDLLERENNNKGFAQSPEVFLALINRIKRAALTRCHICRVPIFNLNAELLPTTVQERQGAILDPDHAVTIYVRLNNVSYDKFS